MLVAVKVVGDIFIAAPMPRSKGLADHIRSQFKLGTNVYDPICFDLYGLKTEQMSDMTVNVSSPRKLSILSQYTIIRSHCK